MSTHIALLRRQGKSSSATSCCVPCLESARCFRVLCSHTCPSWEHLIANRLPPWPDWRHLTVTAGACTAAAVSGRARPGPARPVHGYGGRRSQQSSHQEFLHPAACAREISEVSAHRLGLGLDYPTSTRRKNNWFVATSTRSIGTTSLRAARRPPGRQRALAHAALSMW
jgi:hypothetical protein